MRVEERFREMVDKEPLLRIAVTRDLTTALHQSPAEEQEGVVDKENERPIEQAKPSADCENVSLQYRSLFSLSFFLFDSRGFLFSCFALFICLTWSVRLTNCILDPASSSPAAALLPNTVTNTRQIGVKHAIELKRGPRGFGFGLTSRDVSTSDNDRPVYVKSIHSDGPAFHDGRLRIGDRILEV